MNCIVCKTLLIGKQRMYCQKKCEYRKHDSKRRINTNICLVCQVPCKFKFCSVKHRERYHLIKRTKDKTCKQCDAPFTTADTKRVYCSGKCYRRYSMDHEVKNRDRVNQYIKNRRQVDPIFRLRVQLSDRIRKKLRANYIVKDMTLRDILGCSVPELRIYLHSQFQDKMSWNNYGEWHIDHIVPLATASNKKDIYRLWHHTNLQPLWAADNLRKGAKVIPGEPRKPVGRPSVNI